MANPLFAPLVRFLGDLRYPKLFLVIALLFGVDLLIPDFVPWDDIFFGLATLFLSRLKSRRASDQRQNDSPPP